MSTKRPSAEPRTKSNLKKVWGRITAFILWLSQALLWAGLAYMWNRQAPASEAGSDVLAVSITAVEIMLAALGIVLAIAAFFGFWIFREAVTEAASREAREIAKEAAEAEVRRLNSAGALSRKGETGIKEDADDPKQQDKPALGSVEEESDDGWNA